MKPLSLCPPLLISAALLAGCVSTRDPAATYQSTRSRTEVRDCLLNRLADSNRRVRVNERAGETEIILDTAIVHTPALNFVVRESGSGSTIEMRRLSSMTPGRSIAETCF